MKSISGFLVFAGISLLSLLFDYLTVSAQDKDFQTWTSAGIEKSLSKKLDFSFSEELRLKDNSTRLKSSFTDIGAKYELFKNFDVGIYYRFIVYPDGTAHRPYLDISYKYEIQKFSADLRVRFQHQEQSENQPKNYVRPKLTLSYKINKQWEPFISGELFYHALYNEGSRFDECRLSAGTEYKFNKHHSIKLFYLLDQEFNVNAAEQAHVLGTSYEFDF